MTTMTPDSCAHLGILSILQQLNARFEPAARVASHPGNPPGHDGPEDEPEDDRDIGPEPSYEPGDEDPPRICGPLYDGN